MDEKEKQKIKELYAEEIGHDITCVCFACLALKRSLGKIKNGDQIWGIKVKLDPNLKGNEARLEYE